MCKTLWNSRNWHKSNVPSKSPVSLLVGRNLQILYRLIGCSRYEVWLVIYVLYYACFPPLIGVACVCLLAGAATSWSSFGRRFVAVVALILLVVHAVGGTL